MSKSGAFTNPRQEIGRELSGDVLEIGPGNDPFPTGSGARVLFADKAVKGGRDYVWPELIGHPKGPQSDFNIDLDTNGLTGIESESFDAVIASHLIEHLANPIAALCEFDRVLRVGGQLVLIVPNRTRTFDAPRPGTTMAHLFDEFHRVVTRVDDDHIREFCEAIYSQAPIHPPQVREWHNPARLDKELFDLHRLRSIHAHCWTPEEFAVLIAGILAAGLVGWSLKSLYFAGIEFGLVLTKSRVENRQLQSVQFASDWAKLVLGNERQNPRRLAAFGRAVARDLADAKNLAEYVGLLCDQLAEHASNPSKPPG